MIFADKLIRLRKKMGLSQEELALKMNVSRQAVSKWESAQSIPDLDKILQLSTIFNTSTDLLLKDEIEIDNDVVEEEIVRVVKLGDVNEYLKYSNKSALKISLGTVFCILSPILLIILALLSDDSIKIISTTLAVIFGLTTLFLFVIVAVVLFITTYFSNEKYNYILQDDFNLEYGVNSVVKEKKNKFKSIYNGCILTGVLLCVLAPIPLIITSFFDNLYAITFALLALFLMVSTAVFMFVYVGVRWEGYQKLLNTDKVLLKKQKRDSKISSIIWLTATIVYLCISFTFGYWELTWIIWVVAALIQVIILTMRKE